MTALTGLVGLNGIFRMAKFVVAERAGYPLEGVPEEANIISISRVEISSSEIRKRVRENRPIRYMVPDSVMEYIEKNRLYKSC